ncbi:MAG: hypothetical protein CLLPBCKN_003380 [Chroococcidiopsis cubana SAG 39.79]|nr:hypothetical protein [Chroococcidiopsis cubana SAG 39.79]
MEKSLIILCIEQYSRILALYLWAYLRLESNALGGCYISLHTYPPIGNLGAGTLEKRTFLQLLSGLFFKKWGVRQLVY